jgi:hypothetical protein
MSGPTIDTVHLPSVDHPVLFFCLLKLLKPPYELREAQSDLTSLHVLQIPIKVQFFRIETFRPSERTGCLRVDMQ